MADTLNIVNSLIIVLIFIAAALLMHFRILSALVTLPILAIVIALVCGVPNNEIAEKIINNGSTKLANTYTTTLFGAILAELIIKHNIASKFIKFTAEFASDNPVIMSFFIIIVTSVLFSTIGGLGAVIMVGTIVLPVMLSLSIPPRVAGGIFLFSISLGGIYNFAGWQLYIDVLKINPNEIIKFVIPFSLLYFLILLIFLMVELRENIRKNLIYFLVLFFGVGILFFNINNFNFKLSLDKYTDESYLYTFILFGLSIIYAISRKLKNNTNINNLSMLIPFIPLVLVLLFKWPFITAFVIAIAFCVTITWCDKSIQLLTSSIIDGISKVIPAVFLMIGIGMLLNSVTSQSVSQRINPIINLIIPHNAIMYIITFTILAPLALYRGPLNLWGMGGAVASLINKSGKLSNKALMGMLMSVGQIQGVCDPTNTQNIWIANYLGLETQSLLLKTLPYTWLMVVGGLILAVCQGYVQW